MMSTVVEVLSGRIRLRLLMVSPHHFISSSHQEHRQTPKLKQNTRSGYQLDLSTINKIQYLGTNANFWYIIHIQINSPQYVIMQFFNKLSLWILLVLATLEHGSEAFNVNNDIQKRFPHLASSRRNFVEKLAFGVVWLPSIQAYAADDTALPTQETVSTTFDPIKYELLDPNGGVSYMQGRIDAQDWAGLLEFTKTYDQELRKLRMGKAKKLLQSKEIKEKGTEFCNAVTFDLIGINRSSRSGQESVDSANKYLQELRDDVNKFLALESSIQVEGLTK